MLIAHIDDEEIILKATKDWIDAFRNELANAQSSAQSKVGSGNETEPNHEVPDDAGDPDDPEIILRRWVQHGIDRNIRADDLDFEVASTADAFWKNIQKRKRQKKSLPSLILLDLKLDGTDEQSGLAVLEKVKSSPELKQVPVVMLTTHTDKALVQLSYERGANGYVGKGGLEFNSRFFELITHWVGTSKLPT